MDPWGDIKAVQRASCCVKPGRCSALVVDVHPPPEVNRPLVSAMQAVSCSSARQCLPWTSWNIMHTAFTALPGCHSSQPTGKFWGYTRGRTGPACAASTHVTDCTATGSRQHLLNCTIFSPLLSCVTCAASLASIISKALCHCNVQRSVSCSAFKVRRECHLHQQQLFLAGLCRPLDYLLVLWECIGVRGGSSLGKCLITLQKVTGSYPVSLACQYWDTSPVQGDSPWALWDGAIQRQASVKLGPGNF